MSHIQSQVGRDRGNKGPQRAARVVKGNWGRQGHAPQRKTLFQREGDPG